MVRVRFYDQYDAPKSYDKEYGSEAEARAAILAYAANGLIGIIL